MSVLQDFKSGSSNQILKPLISHGLSSYWLTVILLILRILERRTHTIIRSLLTVSCQVLKSLLNVILIHQTHIIFRDTVGVHHIKSLSNMETRHILQPKNSMIKNSLIAPSVDTLPTRSQTEEQRLARFSLMDDTGDVCKWKCTIALRPPSKYHRPIQHNWLWQSSTEGTFDNGFHAIICAREIVFSTLDRCYADEPIIYPFELMSTCLFDGVVYNWLSIDPRLESFSGSMTPDRGRFCLWQQNK